MLNKSWLDKFNAGITVSDCEGNIIYMNEKSVQIWDKSGGKELMGKSLLDCHPEPAKSMLVEMLQHQFSNCYTIEKNGLKKLIYQAPLYDENGSYDAFVELSLELPQILKNDLR